MCCSRPLHKCRPETATGKHASRSEAWGCRLAGPLIPAGYQIGRIKYWTAPKTAGGRLDQLYQPRICGTQPTINSLHAGILAGHWGVSGTSRTRPEPALSNQSGPLSRLAPSRNASYGTVSFEVRVAVRFLVGFPPGVAGLPGHVLVDAEQVHDLLEVEPTAQLFLQRPKREVPPPEQRVQVRRSSASLLMAPSAAACPGPAASPGTSDRPWPRDAGRFPPATCCHGAYLSAPP